MRMAYGLIADWRSRAAIRFLRFTGLSDLAVLLEEIAKALSPSLLESPGSDVVKGVQVPASLLVRLDTARGSLDSSQVQRSLALVPLVRRP